MHREPRRLLLLLTLAVSLEGCWAETRSTRTTTVTVAQRAELKGRPFVIAALDEVGGRARAEVFVARTCERWENVEERGVEVREVRPTGLAFIGPVTLVGVGVGAASNQQGGTPKGAGLLLVGVGVGVAALVVAHSGTKETPLPPEQKEVYAGSVHCLRKPFPHVDVVVRGEQGDLAGRTNARGIAQLGGRLRTLGDELDVFVQGRRVTEVQRRDKEWRPFWER